MKSKLYVLFNNFIMASMITFFIFLIGGLIYSMSMLIYLLFKDLWSPRFALGLYSFVILIVIVTLGMYWKDPLKFRGDKK